MFVTFNALLLTRNKLSIYLMVFKTSKTVCMGRKFMYCGSFSFFNYAVTQIECENEKEFQSFFFQL